MSSTTGAAENAFRAAHGVNLPQPPKGSPLHGHPSMFDDEGIPFIDFRPFSSISLVSEAIRRRWRFVFIVALLGLTGAVLVSLLSPPQHSATARLFLRPAGQGDPTRLMQNEVALVRTRTVATSALQELNLPMDPQAFLSDSTTTPLSSNVLELRVSGPSAAEAVRRTRAFAESFLAFRAAELKRQAESVTSALQDRRDALTTDLASVNEKIDSLTGTNQDDGDVRPLGELFNRRSTLTGEISQLTNRIDFTLGEAGFAIAQSAVIDPPTSDPRSPLKALALNSAAGTVAGVGLGTGLALVQHLASNRLRRRSDVAAALRTPVAVSTGPLRGPMWLQRRRLHRYLASPGGDLARAVAHLRQAFSRTDGSRSRLVVVSVDTDGPATLALALTAIALAREGKNVVLVDLTSRLSLARLLRVGVDKTPALHVVPGPYSLRVAFPSSSGHVDYEPEMELARAGVYENADTVLALASLDLGLGAYHVSRWADNAVAFATAGKSTPASLRSASELLGAAGIHLASAVLVNCDSNDDSAGTYDPLLGANPQAGFAPFRFSGP